MNKQLQQAVRPMVVGDLEMVLAWRNHPKVRRYMYTQHEIALDEHRGWFMNASKDVKRHLLIYEYNATPVGFINIHQIAAGGVGDWGFYLAPDSPRGIGRSLGDAALNYAFAIATLHKLCGQVLIFNERSIRFHQALGFTQEGVLREQHFDGQHYHDVLCYGLLAREWQTKL